MAKIIPLSLAEIRRRYGLGDVVAAAAQPVAKAVDAVFGTKLQDCGGCAKRREYLNDLTRPR